MKTIAVDAMGADDAPRVEVEGAIAAARTGQVRVLLCGDTAVLERELAQRDAKGLPIEIRHASEVITMHDHPSSAVRRKTDASMRVAVNLVHDGEADAVVSAGNSGAMLACGLLVLKRIEGVDRPAILTIFPTRTGQAALLDMGANVDCRPLNLTQFAVLGSAFARLVLGKERPRVGVLSNGAEEHKGTDLTRETHQLLHAGPITGFEYVGYVEGRDIFSGRIDVVVCDGFTGNLVLKVTEGAAETLVSFFKDAVKGSWLSRVAALGMLSAFRGLKTRMDYAEQGGAPLLGVRGVSIICHGGSNSRAIKNAILVAARHVDLDLAGTIRADVATHQSLFDAARGRASSSSGDSPAINGDLAAPGM